MAGCNHGQSLQGAGLPAQQRAASPAARPWPVPSSSALAELQRCFGSSFLCLIPEQDELQKGQTEGFSLKMVFKNSAFPKGSISTFLKSFLPLKITNQLLPNSTGGFSSLSRAPPASRQQHISPCMAVAWLFPGQHSPACHSLSWQHRSALEPRGCGMGGGCIWGHDRLGWGL